MIWAIIVVLAVALFLIVCYICYDITFCLSKEDEKKPVKLMTGEQYAPFVDVSAELLAWATEIPYQDVYTTSFDGLQLHAKYYFSSENAPLEIMFHGYKSIGIRDFAGGLKLALENGHNVLIVSQRAHGKSKGRCLTFGINERKDVISWVNFANENLNAANRKILLVGISMGASTVLMSSSLELAPNVAGILADCGYTSPKEIIKFVIKMKHLPVSVTYFFVKLGARIFGKFNVEETDTVEALKNAKVPVLFIHGTDDRFVPYSMSVINSEACVTPHMFVTVENAGHGLSFFVDNEQYLSAKEEFLERTEFYK